MLDGYGSDVRLKKVSEQSLRFSFLTSNHQEKKIWP